MTDEKKSENPFLNCRAEGAFVTSSHWCVEAVREQEAKRICELIRGAYLYGRSEKSREIRRAIFDTDGPEVDLDY